MPTDPNVEEAIRLLEKAIALLSSEEPSHDASINATAGVAVSVETAATLRNSSGREQIAYSWGELTDVYNQPGDNPTVAVGKHFGGSTDWARKKVAAARKLGWPLRDPPRRRKH